MTITREDSIVTQVAAKIGSDLAVGVGGDIDTMITNFVLAFDAAKEALFAAHQGDPVVAATAMVAAAFAPQAIAAAPVALTVAGSLRIAGTQHGDLPAWLLKGTAKDGVTEVWDNRDKAVGTNRPWFKQAGVPSDQAKGYWPPKGS